MDMTSSIIRPNMFSTEGAPAEGRFELYREYMAPLANVEPLDKQTLGNIFKIYSWDLGGVAFTREILPGARFKRSKRQVQSSLADHYYLYAIKSGQNYVVSELKRGERTSRNSGNGVVLHSMTDVARGFMAAGECSIVFLPRDAFGAVANEIDQCINQAIKGALGQIIRQFIFSIEERLPTMTQREGAVLSRSLIELLKGYILQDNVASSKIDPDIAAFVFKVRIRQFIMAHLPEPDLSPSRICKAIGLSRASLYRLFEPEGGVANYILRCRLKSASERIHDLKERRTLAEIASATGFRDGKELSRSFKRYMDIAPSKVRGEIVRYSTGSTHDINFNKVLLRLLDGPKSDVVMGLSSPWG